MSGVDQTAAYGFGYGLAERLLGIVESGGVEMGVPEFDCLQNGGFRGL